MNILDATQFWQTAYEESLEGRNAGIPVFLEELLYDLDGGIVGISIYIRQVDSDHSGFYIITPDKLSELSQAIIFSLAMAIRSLFDKPLGAIIRVSGLEYGFYFSDEMLTMGDLDESEMILVQSAMFIIAYLASKTTESLKRGRRA